MLKFYLRLTLLFISLFGVLANKSYALTSTSLSSMYCRGRVILNENRVNGNSVLSQDMINTPNTTYVIRYDYEIKGKIIVPADCTLEFDGGSVSNGSIKGDRTRVKYKNVVFNHVEIDGTWDIPVIRSGMFAEREEDNFLPKLFKLCDKETHNTVVIDPGVYKLFPNRANYSIPTLKSNTTLDIQGTVYINSDNLAGGIGFVCLGNNIHITGVGKVIGDRGINTSDTEWSPAFFCNNCENLVVESITIENSYGDGVYCRYNCNNVLIKGVTFVGNRRCAIAFNSGKNNVVTKCIFVNNGGRAPGCAIELENDGKDMDIPIVNTLILENDFKENDRDIVIGAGETYTDKVIIRGNRSENSISSFFSAPWVNNDYIIKNVIIEKNTVRGCAMFASACFKNKVIISGNRIETNTKDEKTPCINIKGEVVFKNNIVHCPNRPAFENTYGGYYDSKFELSNNEIVALNSILQLRGATIRRNIITMNHLMLFLYDNSTCENNSIIGSQTDGPLLYLRLSDSNFKSNDMDFNNMQYYGIRLVKKEGTSTIDKNNYKNIASQKVFLEEKIE